MRLWDICIRRPIFTTMLISAPLVLGILAYQSLGVDLLPNIELPVVSIRTTLPGASVEEMETGVTKLIEEACNTINGIDEMTSSTREGSSFVNIQFILEKNRDVATQEVRDKVERIIRRLPSGCETPIVQKLEMDASPVIYIAVSAPRPAQEVTEIARKQVKENIESLPGIGAVDVSGGRLRAVQIYVDTDRLSALGLSIEQVRQSLVRENLEVPGGRVDQGDREVTLRTMGRVGDTRDFANLIVTNKDGFLIKIRDIARVEDSFEEPRSIVRLDGRSTVIVQVQKQTGSNTVAVVDGVKERMAMIQEALPDDVTLQVTSDQSSFINNSIHEVKFHLVIATFLVSLTVLFFLSDVRTMIIASTSIPTSIIATFAMMHVLGYTLNNITMLGLILAVGIVIDDAIVIHENIFRHMEEYNRSAREAASSATSEIAMAVFATTMSLLVIFVPIATMQGRMGMIFSCFGVVVAISVFLSMCISFTMTPMLCSRFLKPLEHGKNSHGSVWRVTESFYMRVLSFSLRHRLIVMIFCVLLVASAPMFFRLKWLGFDMMPRDDTGEINISMTAPEGYTLERMDRIVKEIEAEVSKLRGKEYLLTTIGSTGSTKAQGEVTRASIFYKMDPIEERVRPWTDPMFWWLAITGRPDPAPEKYYSQFEIQNDMRRILQAYPEMRPSVSDASGGMGGGGGRAGASQFSVAITGPDLNTLEQIATETVNWLRDDPTYTDVDTSLVLRKPELRIIPNREKAADLGVSVQAIAQTLQVLVGGIDVTQYKEFDEQYDVWLRADLGGRDSMEAIQRIMVPSSRGGLVPLTSVATLENALGPAMIERFARQRRVTIYANFTGNKPLADAVSETEVFLKTLFAEKNISSLYQMQFLGRSKVLAESLNGFAIAFALSFVFMYMVLAAQFESFVHPISILLALPLTLPFAFLSLVLMRTNLDIYAMFGLFMLFGIIKKNGILQIDYTNVLRGRGLPCREAVLQANRTRLRPILMTTVMLIAAMIPLVLATGAGSASRASLAKVILGGQTLSLLLTLIVTPVAYSLWYDLGRWWHRIRGRNPDVEEARAMEIFRREFHPEAVGAKHPE